MLLFPLALLAGAALGYLRGGRFRALAAMRLRAPSLLVAGLLPQVVTTAWGLTGTVRVSALAVSYGLAGMWLLVNLTLAGWLRIGLACVGVGYVLNLLPMAANGAMPVSTAALRAAGGTTQAFLQGPNLDKHVPAAGACKWCSLGDVLPVPQLGVVVSVGDIALVVGVVMLISVGMTSVSEKEGGRLCSKSG